MASFNFQPQFVSRIESGIKGGTIRAYRRHPQKLGEPMHLFRGLRQIKPAYRILVPGHGAAPACVHLQSIVITDLHYVWVSDNIDLPRSVFRRPSAYACRLLTPIECEQLALFDGFDSFNEMMSFWDGRLPFLGHWQCWKTPAFLQTVSGAAA